MPLPSVADRSGFTSDYSLQMAIAIGLCVSVGKRVFCYVWLVLVIVHFAHVIPLNPQAIHCPMLSIKFAIA